MQTSNNIDDVRHLFQRAMTTLCIRKMQRGLQLPNIFTLNFTCEMSDELHNFTPVPGMLSITNNINYII